MADPGQKIAVPPPPGETKSSSQILDEIFKQLEEVSAKSGSTVDLTTVLAGVPRSAAGIRPGTDPTKPEVTCDEAASNRDKRSDSKSRHKHKHRHKHKKSKKHKSRSHSRRSSSHSEGGRHSRSGSAVRPSSPIGVNRVPVAEVETTKRETVVSALQLIPRSVQVPSVVSVQQGVPPTETNDTTAVPTDKSGSPVRLNSDEPTDAGFPKKNQEGEENSVEMDVADDVADVGQDCAEDDGDCDEHDEGETPDADGEMAVAEVDDEAVEDVDGEAVAEDEGVAEVDDEAVAEVDEVVADVGDEADVDDEAVADADDEAVADADDEVVAEEDDDAVAEIEVEEDGEEVVEDDGEAGTEEEVEMEEEDVEIELAGDDSRAASGDAEDGELSRSSTGADPTTRSVSNQSNATDGGPSDGRESAKTASEDGQDADENGDAQSDELESTKTVSENGEEAEESGDGVEVGEEEEEEEEESGEIQDGDSQSNTAEDEEEQVQSGAEAEAEMTDNGLPDAESPSFPVAVKMEPVELTAEGPQLASEVKVEPKDCESKNPDKSSRSKLKKKSRHSSKRKSVRSKVTVINNSATAAKSTASPRKRKSSKTSGSSSKRHKSRDKKPRSSKTKPLSSSAKARSRSRSPRRDTRRRSRSRSAESRNRRSRRSRSRSPVPTVRSSRARRSASRDKFWRNRRSRSRSKRRSRSRSPPVEKIDKKKLLEIARKNALAMMAAGQLPKNLTVSVQKLKEEVVVPIKAGGKSVEELTDFCKVLSKKEMEEGECSDYDSNGTIHSGGEDEEDDAKKAKKKEEPAPFLHHPFKLREQPASIIVNIRNAVQIPTRTPAEKVAEGAKLRIQFPVSSGTQHRQKESEWVPVSPKKDEAEVAKTTDAAKPSTVTNTCTTVATMDEKVFAEIKEPPVPVLDIGAIVSQRLKAVRQLMDNPGNTEAQGQMHRSQEQMQYWAQSKQLPGQFTGSTDAQILTPQQLAGPSSCQAWVRKDQFTNAAPVQSGFGLHILQKMGWKPGEGLGKNGDGTALPLLLDIKLDKKGLVTAGEIPRGCRRPPIPLPNPHQQHHHQQPAVRDLAGKHPVSALVEFCNKRHWLPPEFVLVSDFGPDHQKNFLFKVRVHNVDYQPNVASPNKKLAKAQSATVCLQALGLFPRNSSQPS